MKISAFGNNGGLCWVGRDDEETTAHALLYDEF